MPPRVLVSSHLPLTGMKGGAERYVADLHRALSEVADADLVEGHRFDGDFSRYDVVHVTTPDWRLARRARRAGKPTVITFHASPKALAQHGYATGRRGFYRIGQTAAYAGNFLRTDYAIQLSDAAVCVSERTLDGVRWQAPWAKGKLHLVENGVDTTRFTATGRDEGYVLYVGRLERSKGIDLAVRALGRSGLTFKVAGTGSLLPELKRSAAPNVEFLGEVDDDALLELYQDASACVFPSLIEGYGLVGIESLACGTPTVVTTAFAIRGPAASLLEWIPERDEQAIAAAVEKLMGTKTREWSRRAHDTIAAHHSTRKMARELLAVYERAISARGR